MRHHCKDCDRLECRIRAATRGEAPGGDTFFIETGDVLMAPASITGEVLAIRRASDTEVFIEQVRQQRAYWTHADHIRAQGQPAEHA